MRLPKTQKSNASKGNGQRLFNKKIGTGYDDVPEVDVESESSDDDSVGEAEFASVPAST